MGNSLASDLPLDIVAKVSLPGGPTRFDHESLDMQTGHLFISHMGADQVVVFDVLSRKVIANLDGFPGTTGITVVPKRRRVYVTVRKPWVQISSDKSETAIMRRYSESTAAERQQQPGFGEGGIVVVDAESLDTLAHIPVGRFPDGSVPVTEPERLYVSNEMSGTLSVIDIDQGKVINTLQLGGEAGMSSYDPIKRSIWVNIQSTNTLVAIDTTSDKFVTRVKIPKTCAQNHGLLVDAVNRLAFAYFAQCDWLFRSIVTAV